MRKTSVDRAVQLRKAAIGAQGTQRPSVEFGRPLSGYDRLSNMSPGTESSGACR
jgi:hypothetical protein